jgi:hypothetical protein
VGLTYLIDPAFNLDAVSNDCAVSENSLSRSIALLRRLLGDDIHERRYIAPCLQSAIAFFGTWRLQKMGFCG